jgi:pimeloyl-ACP methyl ester carboxylesterase
MPPLPEVEGVEHRYAAVNGVRLHYAEAGAGDPVLLVHGWPQHWWMWRSQIAPLAERFRVIVPDLRGHGWSDKPDSSYRKTELLEDLLALLDELGVERVRWVGHDWGAYVGMLAALGRPERIERFAALSIPHPWRRGLPELRTVAASPYQLILGGPIGKLAVQRLGAVRRVLQTARSIGEFSDEELRTYEDVLSEGAAADATVRMYRSFVLHELRPFLSGRFNETRLTVPTLWMVGGRDPLAGPSDDGYRDHADDMELVRFEEANHFLPEEVPAEVQERLLAFL